MATHPLLEHFKEEHKGQTQGRLEMREEHRRKRWTHTHRERRESGTDRGTRR